MPTSLRPHRVVALALPGVILLDLAAPTHLFGHLGGRRYRFELAAVRPGPVSTSTGFEVVAPAGLDALRRADTVVVPGSDDVAPDTATAALRRAHARGARVMSICTGAFALARAGLLDGRRATTHWAFAAELARRYPDVDVDPSVLYVDEGSVLTSAGCGGGAGPVPARDQARPRRGGRRRVRPAHRRRPPPRRRPGAVRPAPDGSESRPLGDSLGPTREWAQGRLEQPLDVATLARHACMSPRTFARRFRSETGTTPAQWVLEQRTRAAQALLERTALAVEDVATRTGFGSAATLRTHFGRRLATTPQRLPAQFPRRLNAGFRAIPRGP